MEKQTKHRILGVLVVIGLTVILLPFFQSNKELSTETSLTAAPPFPGQANQTVVIAQPISQNLNQEETRVSDSETSDSDTTELELAPAGDGKAAAAPKPAAIQKTASNTSANASANVSANANANTNANTKISVSANANPTLSANANDNTNANIAANAANPGAKINTSKSSQPNNNTSTEAVISDSEIASTTDADEDEKTNYRIIESGKSPAQLKKTSRTHTSSNEKISQEKMPAITAIKTLINTSAKTSDKALTELKSPAWVVQVGNFKNKENALRILNQLRTSGYRAFIQNIISAKGNNTRVFVGPEAQRTTAHELAQRLENEMHLQGIVVSYKPLTL
jgi:DedD protein